MDNVKMNTGADALTPEQKAQQDAMVKLPPQVNPTIKVPSPEQLQEETYGNELGADPTPANPKDVSFSKWMINISFIVFSVVGIVGSFVNIFDMDKYVKFLGVFSYIFIPLVLAVAGGRAFKNYTTKKYGDGNFTPIAGTGMYKKKVR